MKVYKVTVNGKVYEVELEAVTENNETINNNNWWKIQYCKDVS